MIFLELKGMGRAGASMGRFMFVSLSFKEDVRQFVIASGF